MCDVAKSARKEWLAHCERCRQYMVTLVGGFVTYCQIPHTGVVYLCWDQETQSYTEQEEGEHSFAGAMTFDDAGDCRLGICLILTPRGEQPWVSFGLLVSESNGIMSLRLERDKAVRLDLENRSQCDEFYQNIVEKVKRSFTESEGPDTEPIGFKRSVLAAGDGQ